MADIAIRIENPSRLCHRTADNAAAGAAVGLAAGLGRLIADGAGDHPAADLMAARHELTQAGLLPGRCHCADGDSIMPQSHRTCRWVQVLRGAG
jgi:hypothetical protein